MTFFVPSPLNRVRSSWGEIKEHDSILTWSYAKYPYLKLSNRVCFHVDCRFFYEMCIARNICGNRFISLNILFTDDALPNNERPNLIAPWLRMSTSATSLRNSGTVETPLIYNVET